MGDVGVFPSDNGGGNVFFLFDPHWIQRGNSSRYPFDISFMLDVHRCSSYQYIYGPIQHMGSDTI